MIAALFYPKELKEVIADLRAKDDLNEEAVKRIKTDIYTVFFFWVVVCIIASSKMTLYPLVVFCGLTFVAAVVIAFLVARHVFYKKMAAYIWGERMRARVTKTCVYRSQLFPSAYIRVLANENAPSIRVGPFSKTTFCVRYPQKGEEIFIYYSNNKKYNSALGLSFFKKQYCLSKLKLEEKDDV